MARTISKLYLNKFTTEGMPTNQSSSTGSHCDHPQPPHTRTAGLAHALIGFLFHSNRSNTPTKCGGVLRWVLKLISLFFIYQKLCRCQWPFKMAPNSTHQLSPLKDGCLSPHQLLHLKDGHLLHPSSVAACTWPLTVQQWLPTLPIPCSRDSLSSSVM